MLSLLTLELFGTPYTVNPNFLKNDITQTVITYDC